MQKDYQGNTVDGAERSDYLRGVGSRRLSHSLHSSSTSPEPVFQQPARPPCYVALGKRDGTSVHERDGTHWPLPKTFRRTRRLRKTGELRALPSVCLSQDLERVIDLDAKTRFAMSGMAYASYDGCPSS